MMMAKKRTRSSDGTPVRHVGTTPGGGGGGGGATASGSMTLREESSERQALQKANFNMKLRIFYLEERLAKLCNGGPGGGSSNDEETHKENIQLKLLLDEKTQELEERNLLLVKARNAIETLRADLDVARADAAQANGQAQLEEAHETIKLLRDRLTESERERTDQMTRHEEQARTLHHQCSETARSLLAAEAERNASAARGAALEEERSALHRERDTLEQAIADAAICERGIRDEVDSLRTQIDTEQHHLQEEREVHRKQQRDWRDSSRRAAEAAEEANAALRSDIEASQKRAERESRERVRLAGIVEELEGNLETAKEAADSAGRRLARSESTLAGLRQQLDDQAAASTARESELSSQLSAAVALEAERGRQSAQREGEFNQQLTQLEEELTVTRDTAEATARKLACAEATAESLKEQLEAGAETSANHESELLANIETQREELTVKYRAAMEERARAAEEREKAFIDAGERRERELVDAHRAAVADLKTQREEQALALGEREKDLMAKLQAAATADAEARREAAEREAELSRRVGELEAETTAVEAARDESNERALKAEQAAQRACELKASSEAKLSSAEDALRTSETAIIENRRTIVVQESELHGVRELRQALEDAQEVRKELVHKLSCESRLRDATELRLSEERRSFASWGQAVHATLQQWEAAFDAHIADLVPKQHIRAVLAKVTAGGVSDGETNIPALAIFSAGAPVARQLRRHRGDFGGGEGVGGDHSGLGDGDIGFASPARSAASSSALFAARSPYRSYLRIRHAHARVAQMAAHSERMAAAAAAGSATGDSSGNLRAASDWDRERDRSFVEFLEAEAEAEAAALSAAEAASDEAAAAAEALHEEVKHDALRLAERVRLLAHVKSNFNSLVTAAVAGAEADHRALQSRVVQAESKLDAANEQVGRAMRSCGDMQSRMSRKESEHRREMETLRKKLDSEREAFERRIEEAADENRTARDAAQHGQQAIDEAASKVNAIEAEVRAEKASQVSALAAARREADDLRTTCDEANRRIDRLAENNRVLILELEERRALSDELRARSASLESENTSMVDMIERLRRQLAQRDEMAMRQEQVIRQVEEAQDIIRSSAAALERERRRSDIAGDGAMVNGGGGGGGGAPLDPAKRAISMDLERDMERLSALVEDIDSVVGKSGAFFEEMKDHQKTIMDIFAGSKADDEKVLEKAKLQMSSLENECYQLLDSNARLALQLQQLGLDLQRVYKRFKSLESGEKQRRTLVVNDTASEPGAPSQRPKRRVFPATGSNRQNSVARHAEHKLTELSERIAGVTSVLMDHPRSSISDTSSPRGGGGGGGGGGSGGWERESGERGGDGNFRGMMSKLGSIHSQLNDTSRRLQTVNHSVRSPWRETQR